LTEVFDIKGKQACDCGRFGKEWKTRKMISCQLLRVVPIAVSLRQ